MKKWIIFILTIVVIGNIVGFSCALFDNGTYDFLGLGFLVTFGVSILLSKLLNFTNVLASSFVGGTISLFTVWIGWNIMLYLINN